MTILKTLAHRIIAFNVIYTKLGIGIKAALFLSQIVYWSEKTKDPEGWFYKTRYEWSDETGLSQKEIDTARKILKSLNLIEEQLMGTPAVTYYKLNRSELEQCLLELLSKSPPKKGHKKSVVNFHSKLKCSQKGETSIPQTAILDFPSGEITPYIHRLHTRDVALYGSSSNNKISSNNDYCRTNKYYEKFENQIFDIFDFWKDLFQHPQAKLDVKRRKKIKDRLLEGYTVNDLRDALEGCRQSPWHMGHNPSGKIYDSIDLIFRDAEKVDNFIKNKYHPQLPKTEAQLNREKEDLATYSILKGGII